MRLALVASAFALGILAQAACADPVGRYTITGTNPASGNQYSGEVRIERRGDAYRVTWVLGGYSHIGTAVVDRNSLAVIYQVSSDFVVGLYTEDGNGNWAGVWAFNGERKLGTERWQRR